MWPLCGAWACSQHGSGGQLSPQRGESSLPRGPGLPRPVTPWLRRQEVSTQQWGRFRGGMRVDGRVDRRGDALPLVESLDRWRWGWTA